MLWKRPATVRTVKTTVSWSLTINYQNFILAYMFKKKSLSISCWLVICPRPPCLKLFWEYQNIILCTVWIRNVRWSCGRFGQRPCSHKLLVYAARGLYFHLGRVKALQWILMLNHTGVHPCSCKSPSLPAPDTHLTNTDGKALCLTCMTR